MKLIQLSQLIFYLTIVFPSPAVKLGLFNGNSRHSYERKFKCLCVIKIGQNLGHLKRRLLQKFLKFAVF